MEKKFGGRTSGNRVGIKTRGLALAMLASTAIYAVPAIIWPVHAQQVASISYSIPAGPLGSAISRFGDKSNLQVLYPADLVRGKRSPGVSGSLTREQALGRLLAGTGLSYRFTNSNTVTIVSAGAAGGGTVAADGSLVLDTINIEGDAASFFGGDGYVATRSAAGTKTDTDLIKTPQTINVVKREQIEAQGAQSINAALRFTPGVRGELYGSETTPNSALYLRGFLAESNAFYFNGLKQAYSTTFDPYLLEGIEVIKGPASVLYGQASPGGLVNIVSKLPTETPIHEIQVTAGSPGQAQFGFDFGGPVDNDGHFLYRLTGVGFDRKSDLDFAKGQRVAIAPSFTWKPDEDTKFTVYGVYQHDPKIINYQPLPALGTVMSNPNGRIPRNRYVGDPDFDRADSTTTRIGYNLDQRLSDVVSFQSSMSYGKYEYNNRFLAPLFSPSAPDYSTIDRYATDQSINTEAFTTDNRFQFDFDTGAFRHKAIAGLDYQQLSTTTSIKSDYNAPSLNLYNPVYGGVLFNPTSISLTKQKQSQLGIYAQDQIEFGRLNLLFGVRQDWAKSKTRNALTGALTSDQDDDAFTWRTGAIYNFDNGISPYVSYSESFQPEIGVDYFQKPFKPTTGQQYEVGVKYQPPGLDSFITLSTYQITQQNKLTTDTRPGVPSGYRTQTGEVRSRGIELSATAEIVDNLSLIASYSYNQAEITKSENGDVGNVPWGTPKHTASLWADYKFTNEALNGLTLGGGVRYIGKTYGDSGNSFEVPSFTLVDAAISYDFGANDKKYEGLRLNLNASNLFNKRYVSNCVYDAYCTYGAGREVTAKLTYRW